MDELKSLLTGEVRKLQRENESLNDVLNEARKATFKRSNLGAMQDDDEGGQIKPPQPQLEAVK